MSPLTDRHDLLMANLFARRVGRRGRAKQRLIPAVILHDRRYESLAFGRTQAEVISEGASDRAVAFRVTDGNRPTNVILANTLDPTTLGGLVAAYEHSVFVQGAVWGIDSFDQWGGEQGKQLAERIVVELVQGRPPDPHHGSATNALITRYRQRRR